MRILQLGSIDWSKKYELTKTRVGISMIFHLLAIDEKDPKKKRQIKLYDNLITGPTNHQKLG